MALLRCRFGNRSKPLSCYWTMRLCSSLVEPRKPEYLPAVDLSPLAQKLRRKEEWHRKLKSHETVEEKLYEINMPKYWGWKSVLINETSVPYDFLPYARFATRTHLEVNDTIQPLYTDSSLDEKAAAFSQKLRSQVEDAIVFEYAQCQRKHSLELQLGRCEQKPIETADTVTKSFIKHLNRLLLATLSREVQHLGEVQISPDPRVEAFWFLGGINPSQDKIEERKRRANFQRNNVGWIDESLIELPVNEPVQYIGRPILQLRSKNPLPCAEELKDSYSEASSVPHIPYTPQVVHAEQKFRHATTVPGFWPGDDSEFGLLSFHSCNHLMERPPHFGKEEHVEAVHSAAICASYAWLLGQACYQGFSTFHDPTYPLTTQTVMTDGRNWSFYLYQLNTTLHHTFNVTDNPRCNLCWGTPAMELFHSIDEGKVVGFNEDVLKQIVKMYLLEPRPRSGVEMKPYLGEKHLVADIDYEERREWLETTYKHLVSNRPRHLSKPEIYAWEYLHKIKFRVIHQYFTKGGRRRWFEREEAPPECRRLDDRYPKYKPKVLRPEGDRKKCYKKYRYFKDFFPGTHRTPEEHYTPNWSKWKRS